MNFFQRDTVEAFAVRHLINARRMTREVAAQTENMIKIHFVQATIFTLKITKKYKSVHIITY